MGTVKMISRVAVLLLSVTASCYGGLLGAGVGEGSCAAAPFRSPVEALKWPAGCPAGAECCTEFGYCRPQAEWVAGAFRDCSSCCLCFCSSCCLCCCPSCCLCYCPCCCLCPICCLCCCPSCCYLQQCCNPCSWICWKLFG